VRRPALAGQRNPNLHLRATLRLRVDANASPHQPNPFVDADQSEARTLHSRPDQVEPCPVVSDRQLDPVRHADQLHADSAAIRERELEISRLEVRLRTPRKEAPNIEALRAALTQRAEEWRATLRTEPRVARLLIRRLIGPLELPDDSPRPEWIEGVAEGKTVAGPWAKITLNRRPIRPVLAGNRAGSTRSYRACAFE
jgi:hypothetical protein